MRTFLISYDLAAPVQNKHAIASIIMSLAASWSRPLDQTWFVRGDDVAEDNIKSALAPLLDGDDGLVVQAIDEPAALVNTTLRWFRQRRQPMDSELETNIVAFPGVPPLAIGQRDVELAEAC